MLHNAAMPDEILDAAVEIGIAAYCFAPGLDESAIQDSLTARGVAPWLAARLVFFLPIAFGRPLLTECQLSDTYQVDGQEHVLADDPVWRAIVDRVEHAYPDERSSISARSSEVAAMNQFLHAQPDRDESVRELAFSSPMLVYPFPPLPHIKSGPHEQSGGVPSPSSIFRQLLEAHEQTVVEEGGAFLAGELRFGARVHPQQSQRAEALVDFFVEHPKLHTHRLIERFVGAGETWKEALGQSIMQFERISLHVLISGLLDASSCCEQVEWEDLPASRRPARFQICFSRALLSSGNPPLISPLIDELTTALTASALSNAVHGLSVGLYFDGSRLVGCQVLLDNHQWSEGVRIASALKWTKDNTGLRAWGLRWFALLLPLPAPP